MHCHAEGMTARLFCPAASQCSPLSQLKADACFHSPYKYKCRMLQERPDVRPRLRPPGQHRLVKLNIRASIAGPCKGSRFHKCRFRWWIQGFAFSLDQMFFISVTSAHISSYIPAGRDTALSKSWITALVSEEAATLPSG